MSVLLSVCEAVGELVVVRADLSFVIVCGHLSPLVGRWTYIGNHISNNCDLGILTPDRTCSFRYARSNQAARSQAGQQRQQTSDH